MEKAELIAKLKHAAKDTRSSNNKKPLLHEERLQRLNVGSFNAQTSSLQTMG